MNDNQELVENDFLNILFYKQKICFDLIQIKPKYLSNPSNQLLFQKMIEVYKRDGVIDIANLCENNKEILIEKITEFFSEVNLPILDTTLQFMSDQTIILNNYKKTVINNLIKKLNDKEITMNDYLNKMNLISEINIKNGTEPITEEELKENISKQKVLIELKSFKNLNKLLQLEEGDFLMIGASTGVGKSGLLLNIMNDLMDKYQCIYFNMEMTKSTVYRRLVAINSNIPIIYLDAPATDYQKSKIDAAIKTIVDNKVIIEHKATNLTEIRNIIRIAKNNKKHTIIFLDHIGLIKSLANKSQYEQMTEVAKQLRQICLDYNCTIISACQLNRSSYSFEEVSISMLKDSGELENSSSKVILLYRDKEDKEKHKDSSQAKMYLEIVKNRDGMHGKILYNYDKTKQIFTEENKF